MSREQKKKNFQFQPESKTHFTRVFGERFFKPWSNFEHKTILQNTFRCVYFWLQKLIFAIFAFICGLRNLNNDQKTLLFTLVLSCFEVLMVSKEHPLKSVSQTTVSFLKKPLGFQNLGNQLCIHTFGTPFTTLFFFAAPLRPGNFRSVGAA